MSDATEALSEKIKEKWQGKVLPVQCTATDLDFYKGFRISAPGRPNDYVWSHCKIKTLQELEIKIVDSVEKAYYQRYGND